MKEAKRHENAEGAEPQSRNQNASQQLGGEELTTDYAD
jgi:hypothetical protein